MGWGFEPGRIYNRVRDIHGRFDGGGGRQSGIITFAKHELVIIVSGDTGEVHGYYDHWRDDGAFEYYGQGQIDDMQMIRGNAAILQHSAAGKSLLLFEAAVGGLRFIDEMVYEAHHVERQRDRLGNVRDAIVFELRRLTTVVEKVDADEAAGTDLPIADLTILRNRALAAAVTGATGSPGPARTVYQRSKDVRSYVLARARGVCEGCATPATFVRPDGTPYLEPHHTLRVSDGGPDHPAHIIALCPNCHRRVHAGRDGTSYNNALVAILGAIERT